MNKKKILVLALAVCLIATLSLGTLAWFHASDAVTNQFMIADSNDTTADQIFSVDVWEKTPESDKDTDGFLYEDILPGNQLTKVTHVENTGHYDQYIRVIITISDAKAWIDAMGADYDITNVFAGFDSTMWDMDHTWNNMVGATTVPEELIYVLYYDGTLASGEDLTVFEAIKIPQSLTREQAAAFAGGFTIDVRAQAVQTEHVGASAYAAFKTVGMDITA